MSSRTVKQSQNSAIISIPQNAAYEYNPPKGRPKLELKSGIFNASTVKSESINKQTSTEKYKYVAYPNNYNSILPLRGNNNSKSNNERNSFDNVFNRSSNKSETISYPSTSNNSDKYKYSNPYEYNKQEVPMEKSQNLNQNAFSNSMMKTNYGVSYNFDKNQNSIRNDYKYDKESDKNPKFAETNSSSHNFNKIKGGNEEVPRIPTTLKKDIEEEEKAIEVKPNSSLYKPYSFEQSGSRSFESEAKKRSMAGLKNIGNTCFLYKKYDFSI